MDDFKFIETSFASIKKGGSKAVNELSEGLSKYFGRNISAYVTNRKKGSDIFVMSVTPKISTIDKVLQYMTGRETKLKAISDIWHSCNDWRLDIDNQILGFLTPDELTALTLHEMKHIMDTDRIPTRLVDTVQFGVATSKISQKVALENKNVQKVLEIPIISSCQTFFDKKRMKSEIKAERNAMKKEHRADAYAMKNGYLNSLLSAMGKLEKRIKDDAGTKNTEDALAYSMNIVDALEQRKEFAVKSQLTGISKYLPDGILKECVDEISGTWFDDYGNLDRYITESVDDMVTEAYFTEFGLLGSRLAPIEQNQLDYIAVRIETMETVNDKMMILSYINSKIELVEYYMGILSDKKLSKKFKVPHTMEKLVQIKATLDKLREKALNKQIGKSDRDIIVYYPSGYSG